MTDLPLYPTEDEIAKAVMGKRAKEWPALARSLEPHGLPKPHAFTGNRYWPEVRRFFDELHKRGPQSLAPKSGDMEKPLCPTPKHRETRRALSGDRASSARQSRTG
jgi:hypothetical protein